MSNGIRLSKEYGVNPSVLQCPICGKEFGIAMFGADFRDPKTRKTIEAPHKIALPNHICPDCEKSIKAGNVICIEIDESKTTDNKNPYRTGRIVTVTGESAKSIYENVKSNVCYITQQTFNTMFGEYVKEQEQKEQSQQTQN